jgi:hypothetical protein
MTKLEMKKERKKLRNRQKGERKRRTEGGRERERCIDGWID